jgi:hypothetical protein
MMAQVGAETSRRLVNVLIKMCWLWMDMFRYQKKEKDWETNVKYIL